MNGIITTTELQNFQNNIPKKPYCSSNYKIGTVIRNKEIALKQSHIQVNHPLYQKYLILDIDNNFLDILDENFGLNPNLVIANKNDCKAHFLFRLDKAIIKTESSRIKPLRYAAAVEKALTTKLKADENYSGLLVKNPFCDQFRVFSYRQDPWNLNELTEYLDLSVKAPKQAIESISTGLGRNCQLFDEIRLKYAYRQLNNFNTLESFQNYLLDKAIQYNNNFTHALNYSEVLSTVKSIAKWTWTHYEPKIQRGRDSAQNLNLSIQEKQILSASNTNKTRIESTERKIRGAIYSIKADSQKITQKRIAEVSGLSIATVKRHSKLIKSLK